MLIRKIKDPSHLTKVLIIVSLCGGCRLRSALQSCKDCVLLSHSIPHLMSSFVRETPPTRICNNKIYKEFKKFRKSFIFSFIISLPSSLLILFQSIL